MEDKPNGNGSKKSWLKEGLDDLTGKVDKLVGQGEVIKTYIKSCQGRHTTNEAAIRKLELDKAVEEGIAIGRKAAYKGEDRRKEEKRQSIYIWIAVLTIVGSCLAYGISAFHSSQKSIEDKIAHAIEDAITNNKLVKGTDDH